MRLKISFMIAATLIASAARANPIDALGFGSRGIGMAGAQTAISDDGAANYYNPAGLVAGKDLRIDIGYRFAQPILKLNGHDVGVDAARGWEVALDAPGHIGPFRFAVGILLWLPDQHLTRVRSLPFAQPRFVLFDNRLQRLLLSANLAIQIVPGLYIGGGLTFMSRTAGDLFLKGSVAVSDPDASSLTTNIDVDLKAVRYPQAGIMWEATRTLSFGVTYRHKFVLDLNQSFKINGDIGDPGLPAVVQNGVLQAKTDSMDLFQPWQLTGGFAARLWRRVLVAFDITYAAWSEFPTPASNVKLMVDIGPVFTPKIMLPPPRSYPEPGFHDIVIPRVGVEWRAHESERISVDVRSGYSYEPTPVPSQVGESNLVDCDKHTFSMGVGVELGKLRPILERPLSLDAHFSATYLPERTTMKLSPIDPVGDYRADGVILQVGFMLRSRF